MAKVNLNAMYYDPNFAPPVREVVFRGDYRDYGYVVGKEDDGEIVLYIHEDNSLYYGTLSAFPGRTVAFNDNKGVQRVLERKAMDHQIVFVTKYRKEESLEKILADMHSFVDAIKKGEDRFINYCLTHDD